MLRHCRVSTGGCGCVQYVPVKWLLLLIGQRGLPSGHTHGPSSPPKQQVTREVVREIVRQEDRDRDRDSEQRKKEEVEIVYVSP